MLTSNRQNLKIYFIAILALWLSSSKGFSQVSIQGTTACMQGTSYTYNVLYNNSGTYVYNGNYTWTITGGVVTGTQNTVKSGVCNNVLYSIPVSVTWNSPTGSLQIIISLGSKTISITATPALSPGAISPASQTINYGAIPSTITGTAATGGATSPSYTYTWMSSLDGSNYSDIPSSNTLNYSPGPLTALTYYKRRVFENTSSQTAYTNAVWVNVYPQLTCSISPPTQNLLSGATSAQLTSSTGGGNGSYAYQWYRSYDNINWTGVATTANFSPGVMTTTTYYKLTVTSNGALVTSNTATITVTTLPSGILSVTSTTPSGNGSINSLSCAASGGDGNYTYAWYYSTNGGSTYQSLGVTTPTYTTGVITATTLYYVTVTSQGNSANSNVVSITIPTAPSINANITTLCNGATSTLTASGGSGTYKWYTGGGTFLATGTTYATTAGGTYYATSYNTYGISGPSNNISLTALNSPATVAIQGNTICVLNSTSQLSDASPGGTWASSNSSILKTNSSGLLTGVANGSATITYTLTNACGTSSQTLGVNVVPLATLSQSLGSGLADPIITDTISLVQNTVKVTQFQQDTLYSSAHSIKNVIAFRVVEETNKYIPGDFTATVVVKLEYGHSASDIYQIDSTSLTVNYFKAQNTKYDALKYLTLNNAEYTRVTVVRVDAPTTVNSVSFDTKQVLQLSNSLMAYRYYVLADNKKPVLTYTNPGGGVPDALTVNWVHPPHSNNNYTQVEWAWLEDSMASAYKNGSGVFDTSLLFKLNSSRVDLPGGATAGSYAVPLLYGDTGKLFIRVRGVNIMPSGSRSDGPWSGVQTYAFTGHNISLNWQVTTSFAEEGKRKTVIQYFDGTLRGRQTVTKDNSTQTTVVAETMYDFQGRPAVQILPAPGINNIIAYTKNLNKFNGQADNADPSIYFDFTTTTSGNYATTALSEASGTARYYSNQNTEMNSPTYNKNIPAANGFPYTVTRYTPDGTGRIRVQSGVGDSLNMSGNHTTKYYYGSPSQEELDALFGTEVGNYTHYFKNMVQDANGQMAVSYVDMHGRTIATALAGDAPSNLQALNISDPTQYNNQAGKLLTRNLLDKGSNVLKGNSIESINTILVPNRTTYTFNYQLTKQTLQLPVCTGGNISFDCKFDLQISVTDESGDNNPIVYNYPGISNINFTQPLLLNPGSYIVRKTLTINQDTLNQFLQQYNTLNVGLCTSQTLQYLTDSIAAADSVASGCGITTPALTSSACQTALTPYSTYLNNYALALKTTVALLSTDQLRDIRNQYITDSSFCASLNNNTSHTLENLRRQMLADMVPYSGQYATRNPSGTMANKYDIFATTGSTYPQPFYRTPRNSALATDNYYTSNGTIDTTVTTTRLLNMADSDFEQQFQFSWANSLLPYHPEYKKLQFAEDSLRLSFNFIDSINNSVSIAFSPISVDPFFASISTGADKDSITKYSNQSWVNGYSMWQLAYGDGFGCKLLVDSVPQRDCYNSMPKQFTTTGTVVNTGSGYGNVTLSAAIQLQAWNMFKGMYTQARSELVSRYINIRRDSSDNTTLINQGFRLYFPTNNLQQSKNLKWTSWYPNASGVYPTVNLSDSVKKYASHCDSYINMWTAALMQCPNLANDVARRDAIVASITYKLIAICKLGTDGGNPYGSSNVSPANSGAPYTSFEQAVNYVLDSAGIIPKYAYCNPYGIEFPKPYGKNQPVTKQLASVVDTCNCTQWYKLRNDIINAGYNYTVLSSVNQYLNITYHDTITFALFQALGNCGRYTVTNCHSHLDSSLLKGGGGYQYFWTPVCDTIWQLPLPNPQPLPLFLTCGFNSSSYSCFSCNAFKSLDSGFYAIFGKHPVFAGTITSDSSLIYNDLFAKYVNFKTGLQHNWQYYAQQFTTTSCGIGGLTGTGTGLSICLETKPLNDTTGLTTKPSPCQQSHSRAVVKAINMYNALQQQLISNFNAAYIAKCLTAIELFKVSDTIKEYHYTLYYYDQAGSLVKTVPPKGINPIYRQTFIDSVEAFKLTGVLLTPVHSLVTRYCYNSLNQVIIQKSPDGGSSKFYYDRLGRLALSQNTVQKIQGNVYSYTIYDSLGRITQVGQITGGIAITDSIAKLDASLQTWFTNATNTRNQITQTVYDTAYGPINGIVLSQQRLRNRVSYTQVINNAADAYAASSTFYSYDIHGNVDTLLQDFGNSSGIVNAMNLSGNRFKRIVYNYDLISGKMNQASYQPGAADAYYHRYSYDAENRITDVYSGRDSVMLFLFPEREARYNYYKHGALARVILGQLQVQGLDYAYMVQGWLKAVNPAMGGTLTNSTDTTEANPVAQDVYAFSLNYYKGDYKAIAFTPQATSVLGALGANAAPLFNGNISAMAENIPKLGATKLYNYHYDQLNRIVAMDVYNGLAPAAGTFTPVNVTDYRERTTYDPNGNILTYNRHGDATRIPMDSLSYFYKPNTNQLHKVTDAAPDAGTYSLYNDIKQGQLDSNYRYNTNGDLIQDNSEGISTITWTVYGKISSITKSGAVTRYIYDAGGNRIMKQTSTDTTIYVRDAAGNVLSVYTKQAAASLVQSETHIYGSSRLGITTQHTRLDTSINLSGTFGVAIKSTYTRGEKIFELSNHLGNVLVTVSDRRIQISAAGSLVDYYQADVTSASDYYPYGMQMPGRKFSSTIYRYGFNGQEKSTELVENNYTAEFWQYDARTGRRWNLDPKPNIAFSPYSSFSGDPLLLNDIKGDTMINPQNATYTGNDYKAWKGMLFTQAPSTLFQLANKRFWVHDFVDQKMSDASGSELNVDYYSVNISQLPPQFKTAGELFTYIRTNLNKFMVGGGNSFESYDEGEDKVWKSANPNSAIMRFKGYVGKVNIDDADVMTTNYHYSDNEAYWVFRPVYDVNLLGAKYKAADDAGHPLAGNREFGIKQQPNGYTFYAQGVDRMYSVGDVVVGGVILNDKVFKSADILWKAVMTNVVKEINRLGGQASFKVTDVISRRIDYSSSVTKADQETIKKLGN